MQTKDDWETADPSFVVRDSTVANLKATSAKDHQPRGADAMSGIIQHLVEPLGEDRTTNAEFKIVRISSMTIWPQPA